MDLRSGWSPEDVARMESPGRLVEGEEREELLAALRAAIEEEQSPTPHAMTQATFQENLAKALRLCRLAADLQFPIKEMLEYLEGAIDIAGEAPEGGFFGALGGAVADLEALREIIAAVGDVAAIGANLEGQGGAEPHPKRTHSAPGPPPERSFPLPANLREA